MKTATIAIIAAQTMTFAMAAPANGNRSGRLSVLPEYKFETYENMACRGPHGKHDNKDSYYKRIRAYPDECRERCEDDYQCTGYETGKNKHCELWSAEIGDKLEKKHGLSCYVKEEYYPEVPTYNVYDYEVDEGRACRGPHGKHDNEEDYYELKKLSGSECRIACDYNDWCTGYETGKNNRCELWSGPIGDHLPKKHGLSCYTKTDSYYIDEYTYPKDKYSYSI